MSYLRLSKSQQVFMKKVISKSAVALKRWTDRMPKIDRPAFRHSILSGKPDMSVFPGKEEKLARSIEKIMIPKKKRFSRFGGRTVEETFVDAYLPLFKSWCRGNEDMLQSFLLHSVESLYSFTKPECSIVQYFRSAFSKFVGEYLHVTTNFIKKPFRWGSLGKKYDIAQSQNPSLSEDELVRLLKLSEQEVRFVKQRNKFPSFQGGEVVFQSLSAKENSGGYHAELKALREMDIDSIGLTEIQRECVKAYSEHDKWQSKVSKSLFDGESAKVKAADIRKRCEEELENALITIQDHVEEVAL